MSKEYYKTGGPHAVFLHGHYNAYNIKAWTDLGYGLITSTDFSDRGRNESLMMRRKNVVVTLPEIIPGLTQDLLEMALASDSRFEDYNIKLLDYLPVGPVVCNSIESLFEKKFFKGSK